MNFDKTKAMRDAERYLAQGKLRSAIGEYEQVIKNDPRDFTTLNILGDLYIRTSSKAQAVSCYTSVAEHYSNLGFAQKAIAVYNKIAKLEPNSVEVSAKLAELYKERRVGPRSSFTLRHTSRTLSKNGQEGRSSCYMETDRTT